MKPEEFASLGFDDAWLDEEINEGGERRSQIEHADFEIIKALSDAGGEAITRYLNATWNAWYGAECLIKAVDGLFRISGYGRCSERYYAVVEKMTNKFLGDMSMALGNATTEVSFDDDPTGLAEDFIYAFSDELGQRLESIIPKD